jgi:hypothetical protein
MQSEKHEITDQGDNTSKQALIILDGLVNVDDFIELLSSSLKESNMFYGKEPA